MERITVKSFPDGTVQLETAGFVGKACLDATKQLAAAIGGQTLSDRPTDEMNEVEQTQRNTAGY